MKEINIAKILVNKRKEKRITQDELAAYIGVSKASVSKWETGQSYPDVTFLPQLATYFNISIDELMGYNPQMTKEDISKLYHRLAADFSAKPFEEVKKECEEITKKYFSCFPLLMQIGILYLNHFILAETRERQLQIIAEIRDLCVRIKEESEEIGLCKEANYVEAMCELELGNSGLCIELMQDANNLMLGEEIILANGYYVAGDLEKAKETAQVGLFKHLLGFVSDIPVNLMLNADDKEKYEQLETRSMDLCRLFDMEHLHPGMLTGVYITAAQGYAMLGEDDKALELIRKFANLAVGMNYTLTTRGDAFFDRVDESLAKLDLGIQTPRNEQAVKQSFVDGIEKNPVFDRLSTREEYKHSVELLQTLLQK